MKKTQILEFFRNIRATRVSFISVTVFVAMGIGMFAGMSWSADSLAATAESSFENSNYHDFEYFSAYGMDEDDLNSFLEIEGVDEVEGTRYAYRMIQEPQNSEQAIILQLTDNIDLPYGTEGTLPVAEDEIALDRKWAERNDIHIGDTVTFDDGEADYLYVTEQICSTDAENSDIDEIKKKFEGADSKRSLKNNTFTVTALVYHPDYVVDKSEVYGVNRENNVNVSCFALVSEDAWSDYLDDVYMNVLIRCDSLREYEYQSDEYSENADPFKDLVKENAERIDDAKFALIEENGAAISSRMGEELDKAEDKLEKSENDIEDGKKKIADGQKKLEEGKNDLEESSRKLDSAEAQLSDIKATIDSGRQAAVEAAAQINTAQSELDERKSGYEQTVKISEELSGRAVYVISIFDIATDMLDAGATAEEVVSYIEETGVIDLLREINSEYGDVLKSYIDIEGLVKRIYECRTAEELENALNDIITEINDIVSTAGAVLEETGRQLSEAQIQLDAARGELSAREAQLVEAEAEYESALAGVSSAENEIEKGRIKLDESDQKLEESEQKLADGEKKYADGLKEYENGVKNKKDFDDALAKIENVDAAVVATEQSALMVSVTSLYDMLADLGVAFSLLFSIVGLLVCYSALSRFVLDQTRLIGTKKALGIRQREITAGYVMYSVLSLILGTVIGIVIAVVINIFLIRGIVDDFAFAELVNVYPPAALAIICSVEAGLLLLVTWISCGRILKRKTVDLLNDRNEAYGRKRAFENTLFWKKLSLFAKTIINNALNEKRRVIATVIGVMCCTLLIVAAVTFSNNVTESYEKQTENYWQYDTFVYFSDETDGAREEMEQILDDKGASYAVAFYSQYTLKTPEDSQIYTNILVPDDAEAYREISEYEPWGNSSGDPYSGIWMSSVYANYCGLSDPVCLEITDNTGTTFSVETDGYYTCYAMNNQLNLTPEAYDEVFGKKPVNNVFIINTDGCDREELLSELMETKGFVTVFDYIGFLSKDYKLFWAFSGAMILIFLVMSFILAALVLLNLIVTHISEKKRELITLMINGYTVKKAKKYIYNDTIVCSVIGIIAGIILGTISGNALISRIESFRTQFIHQPNLPTCIIGAAVAAGLSVLMAYIALRRVNKFKLSDINEP